MNDDGEVSVTVECALKFVGEEARQAEVTIYASDASRIDARWLACAVPAGDIQAA